MSKSLKKAIVYIRVSTREQGERGYGLDLQQARITEYARHAGYEIEEVFKDVETGMGARSIKDRPGIGEAMKTARLNNWPILVSGLDRLSRDIESVEKIVSDEGIKVVSCDRGPNIPKAVIMADAAHGQRQGELISERTRAGLQAARDRGAQLGNTKNLPEAQERGAEANKRKAHTQAQKLSEVVQELRRAGLKTAGQIAAGLNGRGLLTPRGEHWSASTIRRPLARIKGLEAAAAAEQARYRTHPIWGAF